MPKIIEGLRERILETAGRMLLETGYQALTVRAVATECGVAVGTVYNYFPSKELLVASLMLEDWKRCLAHMRERSEAAPSAEQGMRALYEELCAFRARYSSAWAQYTARGGDLHQVRSRHGMLVEQLTEVMRACLDRFLSPPDAICAEAAANLLLTYAQHESAFERIAPAVMKLLQ